MAWVGNGVGREDGNVWRSFDGRNFFGFSDAKTPHTSFADKHDSVLRQTTTYADFNFHYYLDSHYAYKTC